MLGLSSMLLASKGANIAYPYKHYRVLPIDVSYNTGFGQYYWTAAEWYAFQAADLSGSNEMAAATMSASSSYSTHTAAKLNDASTGVPDFIWESTENPGGPVWIQASFATGITLRSMRLAWTVGYLDYKPKQFKVQGSMDGTNFVDLAAFSPPVGVAQTDMLSIQ